MLPYPCASLPAADAKEEECFYSPEAADAIALPACPPADQEQQHVPEQLTSRFEPRVTRSAAKAKRDASCFNEDAAQVLWLHAQL